MRINRHIFSTLDTDHGEVELEFQPNSEDDVLVERVGDQLVVAYLVHDSAPLNPMENNGASGEIITRDSRHRRITDDEARLRRELKLSQWGDAPDIDAEFPCAPWVDHRGVTLTHTTLRNLAAGEIMNEIASESSMLAHWVEEFYGEADLVSRLDTFWDSPSMVAALRQDLQDENGVFYESVEERAGHIFTVRWRDVVGPFVIPLNYHDERGETRIYATSWDGDPEDLPDAIWVPDKDAEAHIRDSCRPDNVTIERAEGELFVVRELGEERLLGSWGACWVFIQERWPVTDETLFQTARRYANGVVGEYASWCSGDVYGCVVQVFDLKPADDGVIEWVPRGDWESCYGLIGHDYAVSAMGSDFFDPTLKHLQQAEQPAFADPLDSEGGLTD